MALLSEHGRGMGMELFCPGKYIFILILYKSNLPKLSKQVCVEGRESQVDSFHIKSFRIGDEVLVLLDTSLSSIKVDRSSTNWSLKR